ncbi:MAG: hypothetical protein QGH74_06220, partial [Candidatus Brocadiia bacterium]|nr:hypothetical protein [Candidatus Brocadiia bacterium]
LELGNLKRQQMLAQEIEELGPRVADARRERFWGERMCYWIIIGGVFMTMILVLIRHLRLRQRVYGHVVRRAGDAMGSE